MREYSKRLHAVIPGGAHTYSRGDDQFPSNAPEILVKGKDAYVWDQNGNKYLDYGMGLRAVTLGYANDRVNQAAIAQINNGISLTRASTIELEAAEAFVDLIDSVDMVKFTKNGSNATSAAVKVARAYTGREYICFPKQQPFFSFDDWFIGTTEIKRGIPEQHYSRSLTFNYNDIKSLQALFDAHPGKIAAVMMEPATHLIPCPAECAKDCSTGKPCRDCPNTKKNFLHEVAELAKKNGALLIFDEMITGFRWHLKGAQYYFGVEPDLCTFGKAMANGFSVACVAGKKEFMKLGSIDVLGQERTFLMSTTNGAEMPGMGALVETIKIYKEKPVIDTLWNYGTELKKKSDEISSAHGTRDFFHLDGTSISLYPVCKDATGAVSPAFRTLFMQEMIKGGVLIPWISQSYMHGEAEMKMTLQALDRTLAVYKKALNEGIEKYLVGNAVKPVFRKFN